MRIRPFSRSLMLHPRAPFPDPDLRLNPGPVFVASGGVIKKNEAAKPVAGPVTGAVEPTEQLTTGLEMS